MKREKILSQIPFFLQILQSTLRAGYSFPQSLEFAEKEIEGPLKKQLQKLNQSLCLQVPLARALTDFSEALKSREMAFFTRATLIQLRTGGNLIRLFENLQQIFEDRIKLQRDLRAFTSQGRLSGWLMAGLWPASLLIFWWLSPQHITILFTTSIGQILLLISLLLEIIGFWMIWKIVTVKL